MQTLIMKKKKVLVIVLLLIASMFPISIRCGSIFSTCTTAPDKDGYIHRISVKKPLVIVLIDTVVGTNLRLYYSQIDTKEFVGK